MERTLAVANFFIIKGLAESESVTLMKLIKLVYISHGWFMALSDGQRLINEPIQAWKYGPVVQSVYDAFKKFGGNRITQVYTDADGSVPEVSEKYVSQFLDKMWDMYGKYNGIQLSAMTHQSGTPWDIAWNRDGGSKEQGKIVSDAEIMTHYRGKLNR